MTPEQLQHGKIYKIVCNITNDVYIGSTCSTIEDRLKTHHLKSNRAVSKLILARGDYYIALIEDYPCKTKLQLLWRERHYYDTVDCINLNPPITTADEAKANKKKYRDEHKEQIRILNKQYRADNVEKIAAVKTKWQQDNKEAISANRKIYRENNAEAIKLKKAADYQKLKAQGFINTTCLCGGTYNNRGGSKTRHEATKKHLNWVANSLAKNTTPFVASKF